MVKITGLLSCAALAACAAQNAPEKLDSFPKSQLVVESADRQHSFEVWVADTGPRREQGLMFVRHLPKGAGMLFSFEPPQPVSMWMKNTFISLDMLFIDTQGRILKIAERTQPQSLDIIDSGAPTATVLEIAGGECARLGIAAGDRVHLRTGIPP